uniref:Uncharacterized protein n=1 Tax=Molossus molossus TaxID=27622 RepID=A0A7J8DC95_MOLMO|nr:hypothetical protein HJG59_009383 [Molossus molossus]
MLVESRPGPLTGQTPKAVTADVGRSLGCPRTQLASRPCMPSRRGAGGPLPHSSREALAQSWGPCVEPRVFVKTALSTSKGPPERGVSERGPYVHPPSCGRGRNQHPPRIRPGAWGGQGFRHQLQEEPRTDPGLGLAPESSCSLVSVKIKQVP